MPGSDVKNCSCCRSSVRPCPSLWLTQQVGSLALLGKCPRSAFRAHRRIVFTPRPVHPGCPSLDEATLIAAVFFCTHSGRRVHTSLHACLQNCVCVMLLGTVPQLLARPPWGRVYFEALHCSGRKSGCGDMEVPRHGALMWGHSALGILCLCAHPCVRLAGLPILSPGSRQTVWSVGLSEGQQRVGRNATHPARAQCARYSTVVMTTGSP